MAMTPANMLRQLLAEVIPQGGSENDTGFTDCQINELLDGAGGNPERAAADGWRIKAAQAAQLVDVTEGNASRAMSDLHGHAMEMVKMFNRATAGPTEGRTRIGRIRRGVV